MLGKCADEDVERSEAEPPDDAVLDPGGAAVRVGAARDEHHGDKRGHDPDQHGCRRPSLRHDPDGNWQAGCDQPRDRRDDAHPADRQARVQAEDSRHAERARDEGQDDRRLAGQRTADEEPEREHCRDPDRVDPDRDPEDRCPPTRPTAPEVAGAPGNGRGKSEDDDGEARSGRVSRGRRPP